VRINSIWLPQFPLREFSSFFPGSPGTAPFCNDEDGERERERERKKERERDGEVRCVNTKSGILFSRD